MSLFINVVLLAAVSVHAQQLNLGGRLIDLTHAVDEKGSFGLEKHEGTHVDAPKIAARGLKAKTADELPLERFALKFILVDVSRWANKNRSYQARVSDFADWEKYHGRIQERVIVLVRTGYSKYWGDAEKYTGTRKRGREAAEYLRYPGLHPAAAEWLIKRGVAAVGIDGPAIDHGIAKEPASRRAFAEAGLPVFENLDNLESLPETGGWLLAFPMKVKGAASAPARVIAVLEND